MSTRSFTTSFDGIRFHITLEPEESRDASAERDDAIAEAARQRLRADALATAIRRELDQERAARERAWGKDQAAVAHHTDVISVLCRCAWADGLDEHTPAWSVGQMKAERDAAMTQLARCEAAKDLLEQERDRARADLADEKRESARLAKGWADAAAKLHALQHEGATEVAMVRKRCETLENERDQAREKLADCRDDLGRALSEATRASEALDRAGVESLGLTLADRIDALAQVCAASDARIVAVRTDRERSLDERDVARAQADSLRAEVARLDERLKAERDAHMGDLANLRAERDEIKRRHEVDRSTLESAGASLRGIEAALKAASPDCVRPGSLAQRVTSLASERDAAREESVRAGLSIGLLSDESAKLREERDTAREAMARSERLTDTLTAVRRQRDAAIAERDRLKEAARRMAEMLPPIRIYRYPSPGVSVRVEFPDGSACEEHEQVSEDGLRITRTWTVEGVDSLAAEHVRSKQSAMERAGWSR